VEFYSSYFGHEDVDPMVRMNDIGRNIFRANASRARATWGELSKNALDQLS